MDPTDIINTGEAVALAIVVWYELRELRRKLGEVLEHLLQSIERQSASSASLEAMIARSDARWDRVLHRLDVLRERQARILGDWPVDGDEN